MRQGSLIVVEGQIQTRTFDDPNVQRRYVTEVICDNIEFLDTKGAREGGYKDVNNYDIPPARQQAPKDADPFAGMQSGDGRTDDSEDPFANLKTNVSDDDLPF